MNDPQVVRSQVEAMEDLSWNRLRLQEFELKRRAGTFQGPIPSSPAPLHPPRLHLSPPQISTAQRRANQQTQPRDRVGQYAEKPASKWKQLSSSGSKPVAPTSLKRQKTPARPIAPRRSPPVTARLAPQQNKRKPAPLPQMHAMLDKPLHQKVGYVVRRWFRRKKQHFKALFSLRG